MHVRIVESGHDELTVKMNRLGAFLAAAAIEQNMVEFSDAADLVVRDGYGFGPGRCGIISVNAAVGVIRSAMRRALRANRQLKCAYTCD
jgi:hypothetical protein